MDNILGVICALASGAGLMYFFLQITGGLRNHELEKNYEQQRKENKVNSECIIQNIRELQELRKENEELKDLLSKERAREGSKWTPPVNVSQAAINKAVNSSMDKFMNAFNTKFPPKQ
jgi:hypothetical protein